MVTIVPFSGGKGLFFVETIEEAFSLQELRFLKVKGGYTTHLRRWSPRENSKVEGKFKEGWIQLRGLPFHLWSEETSEENCGAMGAGDRDRLANVEIA